MRNEVNRIALFALTAHVAMTILLSVLIWSTPLTDQVLYLLTVPIFLAGFYLPRRYYAAMMAILSVAAFLVGFDEDIPLNTLVVNIAFSFLVIFVCCELFHRVMAGRRAAETALRERERFLQAIQDATQDLIQVVDNHLTVTWQNARAEKVLGAIAGQPCYTARGKTAACDDCNTSTVFETGNPIEYEKTIETKGGGFVLISAHVSPLERRGGKVISVLRAMRDITAQRRHEELVQRHQAQMLEASRLSSLGAMAGGIAHEINNPLSVISISEEQLHTAIAGNEPDPARIEVLADRIRKSVDRIETIVNSLRMLSRDGVSDPFVLERLNGMVDRAVSLCAVRFAMKNIRLEVPEVPANLDVVCQPALILQVLSHLLNNARDAVETTPEKWVRLDVSEQDGWLEIVVSNSAPNVPQAVRDHIFEPFFTTKELGKGMGLGLTISQSIVERHNGTLRLDPESSHGKFIVRLPRRRTLTSPENIP